MRTPEGHQKSIFNTPKVKKKKQTYIWELSDKVCKLNPTQKHKKVIETPNQPIEIKKSQIKVYV
jgi:hypothetical protein